MRRIGPTVKLRGFRDRLPADSANLTSKYSSPRLRGDNKQVPLFENNVSLTSSEVLSLLPKSFRYLQRTGRPTDPY